MIKHKKIKTNSKNKTTLIYYLLCIFIFVFVTAILMCLFAEIMCKVDIPYTYITTVSTFLICIATFLASLFFIVISGSLWYASGLAIGISTLIITLVTGIISGATPSSFLLTKAISMIILSVLGAFIGNILYEKRKRIR